MATAEEYAQNGYNLILAGRSVESSLNEFYNRLIKKYNCYISFLEFDILDYDSHKRIYESLDPKPNGVICFVGLLGNQLKSQIDFIHAKQVIDSNFTGVVSILNIFANYFELNQEGFIICVTSVAGIRGRKSNYTYGAAKSALITYLSGLRNRLHKKNISVITIIPGYVKTRMIKNIKTAKVLTVSPKFIAKRIKESHRKAKDIVYAPKYWKYIMWVIKTIPERIFKKLSL